MWLVAVEAATVGQAVAATTATADMVAARGQVVGDRAAGSLPTAGRSLLPQTRLPATWCKAAMAATAALGARERITAVTPARALPVAPSKGAASSPRERL